jgi:hypothetical protein
MSDNHGLAETVAADCLNHTVVHQRDPDSFIKAKQSGYSDPCTGAKSGLW